MADPFFFCADLAGDSDRVRLTPDESRHLSGARRYRPGDKLWLTDGKGTVAHGRLVEAEKSGAWIEVRERRQETPPSPAIHLACALPKGDRQSTLLDMATQLGMARFTPLMCDRSVVTAANHQRLQRICLEACKQSRRAHLPSLGDARTPENYMDNAQVASTAVWIAHAAPQATALATLLREPSAVPPVLSLMIGPEGGFSPTEIEVLAAKGGRLVTLGASVLRIETAAIGMLAAIRLAGPTTVTN